MLYPWYEILNKSNELRQGDIIPDCPIVLPPKNFSFSTATDKSEIDLNESLTVRVFNTVVVSQSCDLEQEKINLVLVCIIHDLDDFFAQLDESQRSGKGRKNTLESLKKGNLPSYHLINKDPDKGVSNFQVVDFRNVYGVDLEFLKLYAKELNGRVRLNPPYREHLSQAFARFFMRVGLPNDIENLN